MTWILYHPRIEDEYNMILWNLNKRAPIDQNSGYSILSLEMLLDVG